MPDAADSGFVVDGCRRAYAAMEPEVRSGVEREYSDRLAGTNWLQRLSLRRKMQELIADRIHEKAPLDALY